LVSELLSYSRKTVHVQFYIDAGVWRPTFSGAVKTYGLAVDGRTIITVDDYLVGENAVRRFLLAPFGGVILLASLGAWWYRNRKGRDS